MNVEKYLNQTDWEIYIERAGDIFLASSFADAYYIHMKEVVGIGFTDQLYYYKNNLNICYRSKEEMKKVLRKLADIIDHEPNKVQDWIAKEKELAMEFDDFSNIDNHKDIFYKYNQIFLYNTILPYLLVKSFEYVDNKDEKLKLALESTREKSYYQLFIKKYIQPYFKQVAQKLDIDVALVKNMTMREVYDVLEGKKINLNKNILLSRNKSCYFYWDREKLNLEFFYGHLDGFVEEIDKDIKNIKGHIAFKGKVRGMAKIVNLIEDIDKFEEGDILFTINSNPALIPAIKKAAAIVSDEGGSLCHASIMAREFKIPGVVGTRIATKVFKDGDMVEVDANKGIARKI